MMRDLFKVNNELQICEVNVLKSQKFTLRLCAQSVTLLSTLRDPTHLRRRQCAC